MRIRQFEFVAKTQLIKILMLLGHSPGGLLVGLSATAIGDETSFVENYFLSLQACVILIFTVQFKAYCTFSTHISM